MKEKKLTLKDGIGYAKKFTPRNGLFPVLDSLKCGSVIQSTNLEAWFTWYNPGYAGPDVLIPKDVAAPDFQALPGGYFRSGGVTGKAIDAQEFPLWPIVNNHLVVIEDFTGFMSSVLHAATNEETRPVLTGVHMALKDGKLTIAAADGMRLATNEQPQFTSGFEWSAIVPAAYIAKMPPADEVQVFDAWLELSNEKIHYVKFVADKWECIVQAIDGKYPDYRPIVPTDQDTRFSVTTDAPALAEVLKEGVKMKLDSNLMPFWFKDGRFNMRGVTYAGMEWAASVPCSTTGDVPCGKEFAVNVKFLYDAVKDMDEAVTIDFNSPPRPFRIVDGTRVRVIMPMHIRADKVREH